MGNTEKLMNQIMELKFTSKSLQRQSRKCEKEEKAEKLKVKKAIEKGNMDGARIYAENAIRKRTEQMNYLRLASRLDAVVARLDTQAKMATISKSMGNIVKSLESSLATGNLQKMSETMDQFEKQFVNMEVQAEFMESAMAGSTSLHSRRRGQQPHAAGRRRLRSRGFRRPPSARRSRRSDQGSRQGRRGRLVSPPRRTQG
ncbi:hypothetical protein ACSQ67_011105 [Phaseolus vulgaris]